MTLDDIALANQLAHGILGRSLDELPPPTRQLLKQLYTLVAEKMHAENLQQNEVRFTRRETREAAGLSNSQASIHLDRLVELEYLYAHHGRNGQRYVYELAFDGDPTQSQPQLIGLIDVEQLKTVGMTDKLPASNGNLPPRFRPASGDLPGSFHTPKNSHQPSHSKGLGKNNQAKAKNGQPGQEKIGASHRKAALALAASPGVQ